MTTKADAQIPKVLLDHWEELVFEFTPKARDWKQVLQKNTPFLREIWQTYTQQRRDLKRLPLNTAAWVAPYLLGFHLSNFARGLAVLNRAENRITGLFSTFPQGRVLDLGSGTGAASLAWLVKLNKLGSGWNFELFDRSRHFLRAAESAIAALSPHSRVKSLAAEFHDEKTQRLLEKFRQQPASANAIVCGYFWNEMTKNSKDADRLLKWLSAWAQAQAPTFVLLIEPAEEESARDTMWLRDQLCQSGLKVIYPCPESGSCPMGVDGRDWCYSELEVPKPKAMIDVEKRLGVSRRVLGTSGYLFANAEALRVLSEKGATLKESRMIVGRPKVDNTEKWLVCAKEKITTQAPQPKSRGLRGLPYF